MVDVIAVPDRLEQSIGEPQNEDVLDRLLSEIVVDAIELVFVEDSEQIILSLRADARSVPNGFSMMIRRQEPFSSRARCKRPSWQAIGRNAEGGVAM